MSGGPAVRLALVNDHPLIAAGLRALLGPFPEVEVVDTHIGDVDTTGPRADVALYDTYAHPRRKLDVLDEILASVADKVVVFTLDHDARLVDAALARGASGWLSKAIEGPALVDALVRIARGEIVVVVQRGDDIAPEQGGRRAWPGREVGLTERESEVLTLMVDGMRNGEIAETLFISEETVKSHVGRIYRKLDVDGRGRAIRVAIDVGFRPTDG